MEFDSELCYHINKTISFRLYLFTKKNVVIAYANRFKSIKETQQGFSFILYCKDFEVNYDLRICQMLNQRGIAGHQQTNQRIDTARRWGGKHLPRIRKRYEE